MKRQIFGSTHKGLVRHTNQDMFDIGTMENDISFAVLCDGMGGENGGNVASEIATTFAMDVLSRDLSSQMTELSIRAIFSTIFSGANAKIYEASQKDEELKGMGTTMVLAVIKEDTLFLSSVGDSRGYIANREEEIQVTKDHTVVQMMIDLGEISPEDALHHPKRHFITRAVGVSDSVEMDFYVQPIDSGDLVLLCSDGLYGYLKKNSLYSLLSYSMELKSTENLIKLAKRGGGADNITAVVMS